MKSGICCRYVVLVVALSVCAIANISRAETETRFKTPEEALAGIFPTLQPISEEVFESLRQRDSLILPGGVLRSQIREPNIAIMDYIIGEMIDRHWGSLHFFANRLFCKSDNMLYFSDDMLKYFFSNYKMDVFFPYSGRLLGQAGTPFQMKMALFGQGRMVIAYSLPIAFHRDDPPYDVFSGNYSAFRTNFVEIECDASRPLGLKGFYGRNYPDEGLKHVSAPLGLPLTKVEVSHDEKHLVAYSGMVWHRIPYSPFVRISR